MPRLIDANALAEEHCKGCAPEIIEMCKTDPVCASMMWVVEAPTVNAVEVVHGRWIPNFEYDFDRGEHRLVGYHCDQCGIWTLKKSNYCPNCGAKMDGGNEDA